MPLVNIGPVEASRPRAPPRTPKPIGRPASRTTASRYVLDRMAWYAIALYGYRTWRTVLSEAVRRAQNTLTVSGYLNRGKKIRGQADRIRDLQYQLTLKSKKPTTFTTTTRTLAPSRPARCIARPLGDVQVLGQGRLPAAGILGRRAHHHHCLRLHR